MDMYKKEVSKNEMCEPWIWQDCEQLLSSFFVVLPINNANQTDYAAKSNIWTDVK